MIKENYRLWKEKAIKDPDLVKELIELEGNDELISDAFYKNLEFGTAGLRGVIGAGTNRMNIYTVGQATQGLAAYVNSLTDKGTVAIAYDSRIKSEEFAKTTACVFAANGIKVYIYPELAPTPMLSFAVRRLKCDAGVVITASHNPAKYNGYKAYAPDGSQLGPEAADYVLSIMQSVDIFDGVKYCDFDEAVKNGQIEYIGEDIINDYLENVMAQRIEPDADVSDLRVVYTPLNGAGNKPVREILKRIGVKNVFVVKSQEHPDGNFPTTPFPNPEFEQTFECALELAKTTNPDLLLATDPDSDRVGIAANIDGTFKLFTGNDVGALLLNYILERKTEKGTLPKNPVAVKTIVSTELCQKITDFYGCTLINVLTGFKFIGEQITILADKGEQDRYILGFEESYGYLAGDYARDKDAVVASMLICEMVAFYKSQGQNLEQVMNSIYDKFGYYASAQKSFTCEGQSGMAKIASIMERLHNTPLTDLGGKKIVKISDYELSVTKDLNTNKETPITLPKSNVISFTFEDDSYIIVRPSGTEPKIKLYLGAVGEDKTSADEQLEKLVKIGTEALGF
ncbi:MAG: phospho-sugar mutase [Clostridia bacterium]|nr:phospho-sugar mutase [Clostridia bacterium]